MRNSDRYLTIKYPLLGTLCLFVIGMILSSCNPPTDPKFVDQTGGGGGTAGNVVISGEVTDNFTGLPIDSASVRLEYQIGQTVAKTGSDGKFTSSITLDTGRTVTIIVSKSNYKTDTTTIFAAVGSTNNVTGIKLVPTTSSTTQSGPAASIYLSAQSVNSIGVKESGSPETIKLTFQVVDSSGNPINTLNAALVKFSFLARPNGGEFLNPSFATTNASGIAEVIVTSGTVAGVVQIKAEIDLGGVKITSLPVSFAIHGGLPDLTHFGLGPQFLNFAGYNILGLADQITAYLGDKYGNPVRPGTTVYFTTTGGLIGGSAKTNENGAASVTLYSNEPRPAHPIFGVGFGAVTASTADETGQTISKETIVLFSGIPQLSITPSTGFDIPNGGSQNFLYEVKDQNGNPLVGGTTISVEVEGDDVESRGDLNLTLPDTQSKSYTRFSFVVTDAVDTVDQAKPVYIKISTSGQNGNSYISIGGISR